MEHQATKNYHLQNRFGFHYFPDCAHYSENDIQRWLPAIKDLNVRWLVIQSSVNRAIPEEFIRRFSESGIDLVIDFSAPLTDQTDRHDLELLITLYGKWGAKYAILNHHPNQKKAWAKGQWGDVHLINSVINEFIQFGSICLENNIRPVFPLLTPGGDYWDLSFLKTALLELKNKAPLVILNNFVLSAAAWDWNRSLDWGTGGQARWPNVKPYKLPQESQNQLGFRTYEWYTSVGFEVFGNNLPILLFQAGISNDPHDPESGFQSAGLEKLLAIYHLIKGENIYDPLNRSQVLSPIPSNVIGCCFYLLSSDEAAFKPLQWFSSDGTRLPPAQAIFISKQGDQEKQEESDPIKSQPKEKFRHNRYILIAEELQSEIPELLELLHSYIEKHRPIIGYSISEAKRSAMILAIAPSFGPVPSDFEQIKNNGALVKVIRPCEIPAYLMEYEHAK